MREATKPLVSFRTYRQSSWWNPPPLMVRAFWAHGFGGKLALRSASVTIKVIGSSGDTVMPKAK
jgi:hypothetical protein